MASQVTKPLEEAVAEANGIRALSSVSREQVSIITVEFNLDADLEAAANDVRDQVSKSRSQLPTDIEPTIVEKMGPQDFLVFLTVQSDTRSLEDVTDFVNINIKKDFSRYLVFAWSIPMPVANALCGSAWIP
jgi:multidrug efflux pump